MNKTSFLLVFLMFLGFLIHSSKGIKAESKKEAKTWEFSGKKDTLLTSYYFKRPVPVQIQYADSSKASILVLPGWNLKATEWCEKTGLCKKAKEQGFDLVFVEMQRSLYLKEYYPQTRADYKDYPTRSWLIDAVMHSLFATDLLSPENQVFVLGLSTGGRGAAILALENPEMFSGAAALSGDFNPLLQKNDALMINSLGPFSKFPELWNGDNNISNRAKEFTVPLYIGHGQQDTVCPPIQSMDFVKALKTVNPTLRIVTNFPDNQGHTYSYWDSEVDAVLRFFESIQPQDQ